MLPITDYSIMTSRHPRVLRLVVLGCCVVVKIFQVRRFLEFLGVVADSPLWCCRGAVEVGVEEAVDDSIRVSEGEGAVADVVVGVVGFVDDYPSRVRSLHWSLVGCEFRRLVFLLSIGRSVGVDGRFVDHLCLMRISLREAGLMGEM